MPSKSVLKHGFKAEAERLSEHYRKELGISKFNPLDAFALAKHLRVPIFAVSDLENDLPREQLAILKDTSKFSAVWLPNSDGDKIIIHNDQHSKKRQQSNLMHELAHLIRGHNIPDEIARLCFQLGLHYYNKEQEEEAKYLGACLQISKPSLFLALKNNLSEIEMSDYFNASVEMVRFRLYASGVKKQLAYMGR